MTPPTVEAITVKPRIRRSNGLALSIRRPISRKGTARPRAKASIRVAPCRTIRDCAVRTRTAPRIGPVQADQLAPKAKPVRPDRHHTKRTQRRHRSAAPCVVPKAKRQVPKCDSDPRYASSRFRMRLQLGEPANNPVTFLANALGVKSKDAFRVGAEWDDVCVMFV